jgi:outer membrane biosynthesis protein TonB
MEAAAARSRSARQSKKPKKVRRAKASVPASKVRPPATTGPPKMKSLPLTVVDTMIRSNLSIKRCFFTEQQASGALPSRVNVRFTVMPTGSVSSARVTTEKYKGGTLDSCLGRSFKAIGFPAFEGEPLSMTYPFIL